MQKSQFCVSLHDYGKTIADTSHHKRTQNHAWEVQTSKSTEYHNKNIVPLKKVPLNTLFKNIFCNFAPDLFLNKQSRNDHKDLFP